MNWLTLDNSQSPYGIFMCNHLRYALDHAKNTLRSMTGAKAIEGAAELLAKTYTLE